MLSTNPPSGIQRRQTLHRRQNSTPAAFEAPRIQPLPTTNIQQRRHQRTGMSLDLRGLNLDAIAMPGAATAISQLDGPVSNTNLGQPPQHIMQVAQTHSQPQPGPPRPLMRSPVQTSSSLPRTPHRTLRPQSPLRLSQTPARGPHSPTKDILDQRLKDLQEDVLAVYGPNANIFITTIPTPTASPQKPAQPHSQAPCEPAPLAPGFPDLSDINLQPSSSAMTFNFENLDYDMGYESSSYYTSDALSPSSTSSPRQKPMQTFLDNIPELTPQDHIVEVTSTTTTFSQAPMFPSSSMSLSMDGLPSTAVSRSMLLPELEIDASLEYTGISPEEVQRYISEQDQATSKWTCLYPECGKVFGRRENIRSHVQTHLGDRQYKCNGCGKKFVRQHDLKRHAKIHTGNKPYKCPCGAGFARQDALTRHRQRGMCVGGFENVVRKNVKRGRPKKHRPELEERMDKANKTRRALASASPSVSAGSPMSDPCSSPPPFDNVLHAQAPSTKLTETASFNDQIHSSADHYGFKTDSKPYIEHPTSSFASTSTYADDANSLALLQHFSQPTHTPPMSPADQRPRSSGSTASAKQPVHTSPLKASSTASRSSTQSNPFSTPPTSPAEIPAEPESKDGIDEFFQLPENETYSQFELELQAMGTLDATCEFLDFNV